MTSSRLTDAHSGLAEPQSPHTLLLGFSQRRSATWLQDRALQIDEDRLSNQTDRSFDESTDRLQVEGGATERQGVEPKRVKEGRTGRKKNIRT